MRKTNNRIYFFLFFFILLASCITSCYKNTGVTIFEYKIDGFKSLISKGYSNIEIKNSKESYIKIYSTKSVFDKCKIEHNKDKLYINVPKGLSDLIRIEVGISKYLNEIYIEDASIIKSNDEIYARNLYINSVIDAGIKVDCRINTQNTYIYKSSKNLLLVRWLEATNILKIESQNGIIYISGKANTLDVFANHNANINTKFMNIESADIETYGYAKVETTANSNISVIANEKSKIMIYKNPKTINEIVNQNGHIFRMSLES